jgi:hypothetical protein
MKEGGSRRKEKWNEGKNERRTSEGTKEMRNERRNERSRMQAIIHIFGMHTKLSDMKC